MITTHKICPVEDGSSIWLCFVSNKSLQDLNSGSVDTGDLQRTSAMTSPI
jgi:hypothetical protein